MTFNMVFSVQIILDKWINYITVFLFFFPIEFLSSQLNAQSLKLNLNASFGYEGLIKKSIPSYILVNHGLSNYPLYAENVHLENESVASFETGAEIQKLLSGRISLYSGANLGYRRLHLTLIDENLIYFIPQTTNQIFFKAHIHENLIMIAIPIGCIVTLNSKVGVDFSIRNNLPIKVVRHLTTSPTQYQYELLVLNTRSTKKIIPEISLGLRYKFKACTIILKYFRGLSPVHTKVSNSYGELIPNNIYFSSIFFTSQIDMARLFFSKHK
jgi:hypothetical protein